MESDTTLWDLLMSDLKQWAEQEQPVVCSSPVAPTVSEVEQSPQTVGEALNTERSWFLPHFFFFNSSNISSSHFFKKLGPMRCF